MTVLENYGVKLIPLTHEKIEMVRQWRNDPKVSQYLEFQDEITPEMQEKWFLKISTSGTDYYYIISVRGKEIGLINVKDVKFEKKTGETGVFIWDNEYLNGDYGIRSILCIHDFAFEELGLLTLHGRALGSNKRAIRLNKALGYKVQPNQEEVTYKAVILLKDDYEIQTQPIKTLLKKQLNNNYAE